MLALMTALTTLTWPPFLKVFLDLKSPCEERWNRLGHYKVYRKWVIWCYSQLEPFFIASGKYWFYLLRLICAYFGLMTFLSLDKPKAAKPDRAWAKSSLPMNLTSSANSVFGLCDTVWHYRYYGTMDKGNVTIHYYRHI